MSDTKPLVLLPACNVQLHGHATHIALRSYADAVRLAGAVPVVVPRLEADEIDAVLGSVHGVLLTGSPSNVHPAHFGEAVHDMALPLDQTRDAWVLPLIRRAVERGVPLLGICRGAQEVNVALGGSLHQAVQEVSGLMDHRDDPDADPSVQWGPAHSVLVQPGGVLAGVLDGVLDDVLDGVLDGLSGSAATITVNSLHGQGVHRLAPGLQVEALAPDGLVEAFSVAGAPGFALCVQWHPEWMAADNPVSMRLLHAFGDVVRQRATLQTLRK